MWRHLYVSSRILNSSLAGMGNQWRSLGTGAIWSNRRPPTISLAPIFSSTHEPPLHASSSPIPSILMWRTYCAPFNTDSIKFKAKPTNANFATVNEMFGSSSQPPTTAEHEVIKLLSTVQTTKQCLEEVGS